MDRFKELLKEFLESEKDSIIEDAEDVETFADSAGTFVEWYKIYTATKQRNTEAFREVINNLLYYGFARNVEDIKVILVEARNVGYRVCTDYEWACTDTVLTSYQKMELWNAVYKKS